MIFMYRISGIDTFAVVLPISVSNHFREPLKTSLLSEDQSVLYMPFCKVS